MATNYSTGRTNYMFDQAPQAATPRFNNIIETAIPGTPGLTQSASSIVGNLLSGLPGTSVARRSNAYFGQGSGMPGSEFVRNRGFDLYNQQGEERQQRGIQDLLALISGFSGPMLQERGQDIQMGQFNADMLFRQNQANRSNNRYLQSQPNRRFGFEKNPLTWNMPF